MVQPRELRTALTLMRMARALLDRAGLNLAVATLQHAIDVAEDGRTNPDIPDEP